MDKKIERLESIYKICLTNAKREPLTFSGDLLSIYGVLTAFFSGDGIASNFLKCILEKESNKGFYEFNFPIYTVRNNKFEVKYIDYHKLENNADLPEIRVYSKNSDKPPVVFHCETRFILDLLFGLTRAKHLIDFVHNNIEYDREGKIKSQLLIDKDNFPLIVQTKFPSSILKSKNISEVESILISKCSNFSCNIENTSLIQYVMHYPDTGFLKEREFVELKLISTQQSVAKKKEKQDTTDQIRNFHAEKISLPQKNIKENIKDDKNLTSRSIIPTERVIQATNEIKKKESRKINNRELIVHGYADSCPINVKHKCERLPVSVPVFTKNEQVEYVNIESNYCPECKTWYVTESNYSKTKYQGLLCCRTAARDEYVSNKSEYTTDQLQPESIIHQYGYNVNQQENLSSAERQRILTMIIKTGIWSKYRIISFLEWRIKMSSNRKICLQQFHDGNQIVILYEDISD